MTETTSAPSLRELSEAATPGEWKVCDYRRPDGSLHINTGERHWTVMSAHSIQGCTTPGLDISDEEASSNAAFVARLVSDYRAGRLTDPTTLTEAVAAARAEGVREGLERAAGIIEKSAVPALRGVSAAIRALIPAPPTTPGGRTDG